VCVRSNRSWLRRTEPLASPSSMEAGRVARFGKFSSTLLAERCTANMREMMYKRCTMAPPPKRTLYKRR
jgi:hypothetical protein